MQLLNKLKTILAKKKEEEEYFLALLLKERGIKAVIWQEQNGQIAVVDSTHVASEETLDSIPDEKLLPLCDEAIGLAEKTLPPNVKTTKVIFGLNDWWVEGTTIKEPYLGKIKKISKTLELAPLGFVVFPEAIAHFLKIEEGTPPTVLLAGIGQDTLSVTLVRSGRIEANKTVVKGEESDSQTVAGLIKSFGNIEILPSRILLFDGEVDLEETKQEFISFPWVKELSFLHFPKIDIIPADFDGKAVVSGAAKELGFTFEEESPQESSPPTDQAATTPIEEVKEPLDEQETAFGFKKEQDIVEEVLEKENRLEESDDEDMPKQVAEEQPGAGLPKISLPTFALPTFTIAPIVALIKTLPTRGLVIPAVLVAVFLLVFLGIFLLVPTATITLAVQTRTLENEVQITLDTNATSVDREKQKIPASIVEASLEGEKTQAASGKKIVGDKAKGEVTIYNKTENRKTFPKGTIIFGPNDLRFTLDEETTVASTAAFELTPSSTKAKVTAAQIGEESNVAANTNFPFKDFPTSSYFAKNDAPFAGGTKREVIVVSKEDQEGLLTALLEELRNKAKEELVSKSEGNRIAEVGLKEEITSKNFSKNVDEEADSVTLKLAVSFTTLSYKDSDLLEIVGSEIEKDVPAGFTFSKDTFSTSVKNVGKEKGTLLMEYTAKLLPSLDASQIKNNIAGKSRATVEAYLKTLPIETFTISQNIEFPTPFNLLPQRSDNIVVEITSN